MGKPLTLSERKRRDILAAATEEFKEKGFQATSMDSISARAGVSKRTVYNHFPGKEELFIEVSGSLLEQKDEMVAVDYQQGISVREQLLNIGRKQMELYSSADYIQLARSLIAEHMHSPELARRAMDKLDEGGSSFARWLKAAIDEGVLAGEEPEFMLTQFMYLLKGFGFWHQVSCHVPVLSEGEQERVVQSAVAMFLNHYEVEN